MISPDLVTGCGFLGGTGFFFKVSFGASPGFGPFPGSGGATFFPSAPAFGFGVSFQVLL